MAKTRFEHDRSKTSPPSERAKQSDIELFVERFETLIARPEAEEENWIHESIFAATVAADENIDLIVARLILSSISSAIDRKRYVVYLYKRHDLLRHVIEELELRGDQKNQTLIEAYLKTTLSEPDVLEEYAREPKTLEDYLREEPDEEQKGQPSELKEGVTKDEISPSEMLDRLATMGMSAESRQRVEAEIRYAHKPLWNVSREKQLPELRGMTAIEHLRAVWAEEIARWGNKVYIRTVRSRDSDLIDAVSGYESNRRRRKQDRGALKGLNFVKGFEPMGEKPSQPKRMVQSMRVRKPDLT